MSGSKTIIGIVAIMVILIVGVFAFIIQPALNPPPDIDSPPLLKESVTSEGDKLIYLITIGSPGTIIDVQVLQKDGIPAHIIVETGSRTRIVFTKGMAMYRVTIKIWYNNGEEDIYKEVEIGIPPITE